MAPCPFLCLGIQVPNAAPCGLVFAEIIWAKHSSFNTELELEHCARAEGHPSESEG